jgi:ubiquitin carboxyl-terminal hydrolase L5
MAVVQDLRMEIQEKMKVTDENSNDYFELSEQMLEQTRKREQWKRENQRRKHNYVPLCIQLIKELAKRGNLGTLVTEAQERARVKRTKKNGGGGSE